MLLQQKLGAQIERMMTVVTGQRAESEIQEGDVAEGQPDPAKVQLVEDDDGEWHALSHSCCQ